MTQITTPVNVVSLRPDVLTKPGLFLFLYFNKHFSFMSATYTLILILHLQYLLLETCLALK